MSDDMVCTCLTRNDHPSMEHQDHCEWTRREKALLEGAEASNVLVFRNGAGQPVAVPEQVVEEAERPYRAYKLMTAGRTWADIARIEQYSDAAAARYDVQRYIQEGKQLVVSNTRRDQLQLEVARLDALMAAYWEDGIDKKHLPSGKMVLDTIMARSKLLALAEMVDNEGGDDRPQTVIVPSGDDYGVELTRLADES